MPLIKPAGLVLAGLLAISLAACGGDAPEAPSGTATPTREVSASTPQLDDSSRVNLETTLSTAYYPVSGTTTEDIFLSIEANGPTDNIGRQGSGLTSVDWEYEWRREQTPSGGCAVSELTIRADITIELPRHEDVAGLPDRLRENWLGYAEGVAEHEQRHVDIYLEGAQTIRAAMETIGLLDSCGDLEARIETIWNDEQLRINGRQEAFHGEENARLAATRGPLESQIEANRARLDGLRGQIFGLDQEIARLKGEMAVFDNEVAAVDTQIKQINDQFPNELPPTIRQRLEELIDQSNRLLATYNQKVDEHNAAVTARNALIGEYDTLLLETNAMVDEFNWSR